MNTAQIEQNWLLCKERFNLSDKQLQDLKTYAHMLQAWNKKINVTALDDIQDIVNFHFQDSLEIAHHVDFTKIQMIADVGSGGGFPGLPLKILFDHLQLVIIEVNHKKLDFLKAVVAELGIEGVQFFDLDWRTFLRKIALPIDLFLARASLQPEELLRIFKPQSTYGHARLIYWASQHWQADTVSMQFLNGDVPYEVGGKQRRYIFFEKKI